MHKSRGEQDAGAKMADAKEEGLGNADEGELGGEHGDSAGQARDGEDDEEGTNVERRVVLACAGDAADAGILALGEAAEGGFDCGSGQCSHSRVSVRGYRKGLTSSDA